MANSTAAEVKIHFKRAVSLLDKSGDSLQFNATEIAVKNDTVHVTEGLYLHVFTLDNILSISIKQIQKEPENVVPFEVHKGDF